MTETNVPLLPLTRAWLIFMERQYYTLSSFKKENAYLGVTREIPLEILAKMMWGDRMCCFYQKSGIKSPLWFATWPVTKLKGLSKAAIRHVADNCQNTVLELGGVLITCAYASYRTGTTYKVDAPLNRIAKLLQTFNPTGDAIGHPRIGCGPGVMKYVKTPYPMFPNIPFDPDDIRPFNIAAASADIKVPENKKRSVAKGFYLLENMNDPEYSWPLNPCPEIPAKNYIEDAEGGVGSGLLQSALNYRSAEARSEHITL